MTVNPADPRSFLHRQSRPAPHRQGTDALSRETGQQAIRRSRWRADLRLLPSAAAAWAAAAIAVRADATSVTAAGLLAATVGLALTCVVFLLPGRSAGRAPDVPVLALSALSLSLSPVAAVSLVLLSAGGSLARAEAGPLDDAVRSGSPFTAILRVSGEPSLLPSGRFEAGDRYLVEADVIGGRLHRETFTSKTPVVVIGPDVWAGVGTGDTVRVLGTVEPPDRVGRARAVFLPISRPSVEEAEGWLGYTDHLRARFRHLADRDARDGGLLPGMALGDRIGLEPDLENAMKLTGLTHLTAVSGANCSYVVAFAFLGLRAARLPRLPAATGAVLALAAFVLLVRPEPSVLRAAVMGSIGVAAVLSGRGRVSLTLLMLSVIVLLATDPWLCVSFAFMLSVAATLGLVTAGPVLVSTLETVMPRVAAQLLAIPLTAQLFCTPILVLIQPALPVYSLLANVLASPVVPGVTLVGMAAVLALVGVPVLAPFLIALAQWGTRWVAGIADTLASAPVSTLPWIPGAPGAAVAALSSLALVLLMSRSRTAVAHARQDRSYERRPPAGARPHPPSAVSRPGSRWRAGRTPGLTRARGPGSVIALVLLAVLLTGIVVLGRLAAPPQENWIMAMCDVGQGDGIVVRTTPGHALVVDTGPDPDAMDRCLDDLAVEVIDALVITHLHEDHYGGVGGATRGRQVSAVYYSSGEGSLPPVLTEAAAVAAIEPEQLTSTTPLDVPPLDVGVLWPAPDALLSEENNASAVLDVVVQTEDRPVRLLLTGDLEEDAAAELLSAVPALADGRVDILKVAHHGARNGGSALIEAVAPRLALISVGEDNDYGHPHPAIVDALGRSGAATARTDELGSFTVSITDSTMEVRPFK